MIWHELSQSADPADWATRYPYMFVHVDITFHYLTVVERYVSASGDTAVSATALARNRSRLSLLQIVDRRSRTDFPAFPRPKKEATNRTR